MKGIFGIKIGMIQIWKNDCVIFVMVVLVGFCFIVQCKIVQIDGYEVVQIGYVFKVECKVNKFMQGYFVKVGVVLMCILCEFRGFVFDGDSVNVDIFVEGEKIDVIGISKGKGIQGVMKCWNFVGGFVSYGLKKWYCCFGLIGQCKILGCVYKGKCMVGYMGMECVIVQNFEVVEICVGENLIFVKGVIFGVNGGFVVLCSVVKVSVVKGGK